jgi:hypothetical protein
MIWTALIRYIAKSHFSGASQDRKLHRDGFVKETRTNPLQS